MLTVREFVESSYQLVTPSSPTVPLHGSDLSTGIKILNMLLKSYAATGLMITIASTQTVPLSVGQQEVVTGDSAIIPTPDITFGRLANLENAWLELSNVDYPLIQISIDEFESAWKYQPLSGLPRFIIVYPDIQTTRLRIYPSPSQFFQFFCRGKFQLGNLNSNSDMSILPEYYQMYLMFALAKKLAKFKGRNSAWTPDLELEFQELRDVIIASSEVNLAIGGDRQSMLNGAWRVRAGV